MVEYAREQGKPIIVVRAGNRHPGNGQPTSLGADQGTVLDEGLSSE